MVRLWLCFELARKDAYLSIVVRCVSSSEERCSGPAPLGMSVEWNIVRGEGREETWSVDAGLSFDDLVCGTEPVNKVVESCLGVKKCERATRDASENFW